MYVKFREFFCPEIFHEIFHELFHEISEIFQKFHAVLFIVHCNKVSKPVKGRICCYA